NMLLMFSADRNAEFFTQKATPAITSSVSGSASGCSTKRSTESRRRSIPRNARRSPGAEVSVFILVGGERRGPPAARRAPTVSLEELDVLADRLLVVESLRRDVVACAEAVVDHVQEDDRLVALRVRVLRRGGV